MNFSKSKLLLLVYFVMSKRTSYKSGRVEQSCVHVKYSFIYRIAHYSCIVLCID